MRNSVSHAHVYTYINVCACILCLSLLSSLFLSATLQLLLLAALAHARHSRWCMQNLNPTAALLPTTNGPWATGDALDIAERAGAHLRDLSEVQIHPTGGCGARTEDGWSQAQPLLISFKDYVFLTREPSKSACLLVVSSREACRQHSAFPGPLFTMSHKSSSLHQCRACSAFSLRQPLPTFLLLQDS